MAWGDTPGIHLPYTYGSVIQPELYRVGINYFPNRIPLQYRLSKLPLDSLTFNMNSDTYRPRTTILQAAFTSAGGTLTVADTTGLDVGDVVEVDTERFIITAVNNANTLSVTFAYEGTTQANHANNAVVTIITNARTGGEIDQNGLSMLPTLVGQNAQTIQHAYQVGGALQSAGNFMQGAVTPLDRDRMLCMQTTLDDFEKATYYGRGQTANATNPRPTMKGLKTLLTSNNITTPTAAGAYKPSDFTRDVMQSCFNNGGQPDLIIVSTDFMSGFSVWGWNLQIVPPGSSVLGVAVQTFALPFLGTTQIAAAPLLKSGTAFALNTQEVRLRIKRPLFDKPRGSRGDATEGDMIMEGAIEVENQMHHSWTEGVTGFAVQS